MVILIKKSNCDKTHKVKLTLNVKQGRKKGREKFILTNINFKKREEKKK